MPRSFISYLTLQKLHVKLCNQDVHIVSKEIYVRNYISKNIYDRAIKQTLCAFNAKGNHIISDFSMLDGFSLQKLLTTYCMSLYGCEIWNYDSRYVNEMFKAWRKMMRKLFKLPNRTHNYVVCGHYYSQHNFTTLLFTTLLCNNIGTFSVMLHNVH